MDPQQSVVKVLKETKEDNMDDSKKEQEQSVGFCELFRFATSYDYLFMLLGTICALGVGAALPAFALLWGNITDQFAIGGQALQDASLTVMLQFIYIGIGSMLAGLGMFAFWMISGERQAITCRQEYLKILLRQQIGWFDTINQAQLSSNFAKDCFAFQGAIGEKVSTIFMTLGMFVSGFIIAFVKGWLMALVVLASIPVIMIGGVLFSKATEGKDKEIKNNYSKAGGIAEQAIASIKTVKQLNGEQYESDRYNLSLKNVATKSIRFGIFAGGAIGILFLAMLTSYALGFWFGSHCVEGTSVCPPSWNNGKLYTTGDMVIVFFSILMAGFNLGQLTPALKKIAEGRSAAARIFKIIDRQSLITSKPLAVVPKQFKGIIRFDNVTFAYPKDPSRNILQNFTIEINSNKSAFVGESGCGKSTIFQLLLRFYDPNEGTITIDGVDLRDLDLRWLRQQFGYVGQEPVLFATTIKENLLFGNEHATEEQIEEALRRAEAYEFIMTQFPQKLETEVGTGGGQLSGGQKQRIAIARALLKKPKILLLDEATSALDRRNERLIQNTLNQISENQKTITIAHRTKTIMNSDQIFVVNKGHIEEQGSFKQLKRFKGIDFQIDDPKDDQKKQIVKEEEQNNDLPKSKYQLIKEQIQRKKQKKIEQQEQQKNLTDKYKQEIFGRVFSYASDHKCFFFLGILFALANGVIFPIFSIFLAKMLAVLLNFNNNPSQSRTDANTYALIYFLLAIASFFINLFQLSLFNFVGQKITQQIRLKVFQKLMKMPVSWFDRPRNNSGALTVRLAEDCQAVNGLTTTYISVLLQNLSTLVSSVIIAFIYDWRTALVALAIMPLMIIAGAVQMKLTTGFSDKTDKAYEQSSFLITEATVNIRTVTSFGYEELVLNRYKSYLEHPLQIAVQKGNVSGFLFGLSQFVMFLVFGLIFFMGSVFINNFNVTTADVFTAIYSLVFAGMTIGNNSHFIPDIGKAKNAAANLFCILDDKDEDQLQVDQSSQLLKTSIKGDIQFNNVTFKYESRQQNVFSNINLDIKAGQKIAFVGSSGCGKSTILQLLQRFYNPLSGTILIDGKDIKAYDIHYLRSCFGVVSQQPCLFNDTILQNIRYNLKTTNEQSIRRAAIQSNFNPQNQKFEEQKVQKEMKNKQQDLDESRQTIDKKPATGFDKNVGLKGSHISGGQKQRVAIARAIIRQPIIMLLDEATSALDTDNEKKVQITLDRIMKGKTSITVAHRINTIANSDEIFVFDQGEIVERGNYASLVAKKGKFYNLEKGIQFL